MFSFETDHIWIWAMGREYQTVMNMIDRVTGAKEVLQPVLRLMLLCLPGHLVPSKQVTFPGHLIPRQNCRLRICWYFLWIWQIRSKSKWQSFLTHWGIEYRTAFVILTMFHQPIVHDLGLWRVLGGTCHLVVTTSVLLSSGGCQCVAIKSYLGTLGVTILR